MVIAAIAVVAALGAAATPALAESPWWHLSTETRPSYLQPGQETDEIWQLTVSASGGTYRIDGENSLVGFEVGAEPEQVQAIFEGKGVEGEGYGAGNVEVTSPCTASPNPSCPKTLNAYEVYDVKFVGKLAYRHLAQPYIDFSFVQGSLNEQQRENNEGSLTGGRRRVELTDIARGRPAGLILVTAVNLGDANAGCVKVAPGAGKYQSASCEEEEAGEYEKVPITLKDAHLPAGLEPVWIEGTLLEGPNANDGPLECSLGSLSCTFTGTGDAIQDLPPYEQMQMRIAVNSIEAKANGAVNEASVTGGGAPAASAKQAVTVSEHAAPFGVSEYQMRLEEDGGATDTQAGSHPFQFTTTINFNQALAFEVEGIAAEPIALAKTLHFKLPPGLIGNPTALPQCSLTQFFTFTENIVNQCPQQSVVGVARVLVRAKGHDPVTATTISTPLFNLDPAVGEPARFGFVAEEKPVLIDTAVRTGGDYGVTATAENITQLASFLGSEVTFWGVPGDPRHDNQRGAACLRSQDPAERERFGCDPLGEAKPAPFLSLPTSCPGPALQTLMEGESWASFGRPSETLAPLSNTAPMATMDGCNRLPFSPSIKVTPDGTQASKPTGLNVDVHVNQDSISSAGGLAESAVKSVTVTLPQGFAVNPAGGDGLQACSEALVGFQGFEEPMLEQGVSVPAFTPYVAGDTYAKNAVSEGRLPDGEGALSPGVNFCADASKIGEVTIKTPLLPAGQFVKGFVYLATQNQNPFGSLIAMYIVAEDPVSGVVVKLPGAVHLTESGQIVTTFENTPQLAFEDAELHFFGGERAPLSSPAHCGAYTTTASFTPWSGGAPVSASSTFNITSGPNGSPCPGASLPFSPSLTGGTTNNNAGAFSPLTTTIGREDGQQDLQSVQLHMPAGLEGLLSNVKLCPEAQANEGTCGPESLIGETVVSAGVGNDPVSVTGGKVYITEKYAGAPFGLSIVNPVKAGPFDLERDTSNPAQNPPCDCIVVRAKIEVDPHTADLTVTTDSSGPHAIPHMIDGIPVQIKRVNVLVNREHFTFNPTSCSPMPLTGSIGAVEGASQPLSVPFQATNCAVLKFTPKVAVATAAHASKANGASLNFKIAYPKGAMGTQSWFNEAKFDIPKQLPSRLTTIQKACLAATFESNRAACPAASKIGHAIVHTQVLPVPLEGPVYFVSYGGAKFPEAVMVLDGYGVHIELHGETLIKNGVTSATFRNTPDVPFESIEVSVPTGPFSEFGANLPGGKYDFCGQKLSMPTLFKAQNGLEVHQNTPVSVSGCSSSISLSAHKLKGRKLTLTVYVPAAGKLKASGKGLKSASKSAGGQELLTLTLQAKRKGKFKTKVKLSFTPSKGKRQGRTAALRA